ncbi:MAG TPA: TonB-dependent receptor [Dongiaceae bacterium]|nr:TonB-dependent receptor [Dongiaceae bacterium]
MTSVTPGVIAEEMEALLGLSLEQLMNVPVSSPTLTPESVNRTPAAISVFSHEEIQRTGFDYLHELLNLMPGMAVTRSPDGPFSAVSRGRTNSTSSREILVLVDGVPRNEPRGGGASNQLDYFPLERIERLEVVRGPGSALYGENAFTAVINIITRRGQNEVAALAGSNDRVHLHGLGHQSWNNWQLDGFVRAEKDNGDDYTVADSFSTGRVDTGDPIRNLDASAVLASADTRISAEYQQRHAEDFYYAETVADDYNDFDADYMSVHVEQQLHWLENGSSRLLAGWQRRETEAWVQGTAEGALYSISTPQSTEPLIAQSKAQSTVWEAYWKNDWSPSEWYSVQFGADWREECDDLSRQITNYNMLQLIGRQFPIQHFDGIDFELPFTTEQTRRVLGAYLQYQQQLAEATKLTLSLRHDDYSDVANRTSPRVALVHQLTEQNSLKLLYAEAFRAPSLFEMTLQNNTRAIGNPDLEHEIVKTWDAIWLYDGGSQIASIGWFHNQYIDPIVIVQSGNVRTYANVDEESSEGFELAARWQPIKPLQLRATWTRYTDLPDSAFREADDLGSLMVNYSHANWNLNLAAVHHGERAMLTVVPNQVLELDPYWQLTGKLLFDLDNGVQWWLQGKNLMDTDIETGGQGNRMKEGMPNRGRELGVGILWRY